MESSARGLRPGGGSQTPRKNQYPQHRDIKWVAVVVDVKQVDVSCQQPDYINAGLVKTAPPVRRQVSRESRERGCCECNEKSEANEIRRQSKAVEVFVKAEHVVGDKPQMP